MTPGGRISFPATSPPPATSPAIDDYERRRRAAETVNERVVSTLIVALTGSTLLVQMVWNLEFSFVRVPDRVKLVCLAIIGAHAGWWRRSPCNAAIRPCGSTSSS